jgi:hypothetical protein
MAECVVPEIPHACPFAERLHYFLPVLIRPLFLHASLRASVGMPEYPRFFRVPVLKAVGENLKKDLRFTRERFKGQYYSKKPPGSSILHGGKFSTLREIAGAAFRRSPRQLCKRH